MEMQPVNLYRASSYQCDGRNVARVFWSLVSSYFFGALYDTYFVRVIGGQIPSGILRSARPLGEEGFCLGGSKCKPDCWLADVCQITVALKKPG